MRINVSICSSHLALNNFSLDVNNALSLEEVCKIILDKLSPLEYENFTFGFFIDSQLVYMVGGGVTRLYKSCGVVDFDSSTIDLVISKKGKVEDV